MLATPGARERRLALALLVAATRGADGRIASPTRQAQSGFTLALLAVANGWDMPGLADSQPAGHARRQLASDCNSNCNIDGCDKCYGSCDSIAAGLKCYDYSCRVPNRSLPTEHVKVRMSTEQYGACCKGTKKCKGTKNYSLTYYMLHTCPHTSQYSGPLFSGGK